jgi:hypothetical protein
MPKGMDPNLLAKGTNVAAGQPCDSIPAVQGWLSLAQVGRYEDAWRKYMEEKSLLATRPRAHYHSLYLPSNRRRSTRLIA